ncbi:MAG: glutathione S-transferase family protein [Pseudomonadota bacterium]
MKLISFTICPFLQRVTAVLAAKNAIWESIYIDRGEKPICDKPEWFIAMSPHGQAPILITEDGRSIFESDPISEYVDEAIGEPISACDPVKKAQDRAWNALANKVLSSQCAALRSASKSMLETKLDELGVDLEKIQNRIQGEPYVDGETIGMIDLAWLPILHRFDIVERHTAFDILSEFPQLKRWQRALLATGIAEKSVAENFEQRFSAFYFAPENYLGKVKATRVAA